LVALEVTGEPFGGGGVAVAYLRLRGSSDGHYGVGAEADGEEEEGEQNKGCECFFCGELSEFFLAKEGEEEDECDGREGEEGELMDTHAEAGEEGEKENPAMATG
jgi:hypothetical protein